MTASELKKIKFGVDNEKYRCYTPTHQAKALWVEPEAPFSLQIHTGYCMRKKKRRLLWKKY